MCAVILSNKKDPHRRRGGIHLIIRGAICSLSLSLSLVIPIPKLEGASFDYSLCFSLSLSLMVWH